MKTKKFVMYGPYRAGKETFLSTLVPDFMPQSYSEGKGNLAFGKMPIEDGFYYFYSIVSLKRFDFMWEILSEGASGYLFIVDSTRPETFLELRRAIRIILEFRYAPYIVIANHQDQPDTYHLDLMHRALDLDEAVPIVPCRAYDKASAQAAFDALLQHMTQKQPPHNMKFLICGPYDAGKTTFLKSLASTVERQSVYNGIGLGNVMTDSGSLRHEDNVHRVYTFGTLREFDIVSRSIADFCAGYLFIVDSTRPETFREFRRAIRDHLTHRSLPYIVIVNKQDHPEALAPEQIHQLLGLESDVPVVPCVAHDKISVKAAFEVLLRRVEEIRMIP